MTFVKYVHNSMGDSNLWRTSAQTIHPKGHERRVFGCTMSRMLPLSLLYWADLRERPLRVDERGFGVKLVPHKCWVSVLLEGFVCRTHFALSCSFCWSTPRTNIRCTGTKRTRGQHRSCTQASKKRRYPTFIRRSAECTGAKKTREGNIRLALCPKTAQTLDSFADKLQCEPSLIY